MTASASHWRVLISVTVALMGAAFIVPRFVRPPDIAENRVLATAPAWPQGLGDLKAFRTSTDAWVADRFPARPYLIGLLNRARMLAGVTGSAKVIVGTHGWLFYDDSTHFGVARGEPPWTPAATRDWLRGLAGRTEALKAQGVPYLVLVPAQKETVYPQFGPSWFAGPSPNRAVPSIDRLVGQTAAGDLLYIQPALSAAAAGGEKVYSRHDTHWTGRGAYEGYVVLMRRLQAIGVTTGPRPLSAFQDSGRPAAIRPRDLALMLGVASFVDVHYSELEEPGRQARLKITWLSDKHDWTGPRVIDTGEVGKPTLLITLDSFSNALLPFLYSHFSRIVTAHNQDGPWRPDLIARFKPDVVLLEVVESGLGFSLTPGPTPSAAASARIDAALGPIAAVMPADLPADHQLRRPGFFRKRAIKHAGAAANCNVETVVLGRAGEAGVLSVAGWIADLADADASTDGFVGLEGPHGWAIAELNVGQPRPDVAAAFHRPAAARSGYGGAFWLKIAPLGAYAATVFRRSASGWKACRGAQPLVLR